MPDLPIAALKEKLGGVTLARDIRLFQEITSTNDIAAEMGREGAPEGLIIFARKQTRGRGRQGRVWESEEGSGLWFSFLMRPQAPLQQWPRLTTWAAVAIAEAIEEVSGLPAAVKWPNGVYLEGKKAVGILTETHLTNGGFAIVGVGINGNQTAFPPPLDETATSIAIATGCPVDLTDLAAAVIRRLDALHYQTWFAFPELVQKARDRAFLLGRWVELSASGETVSGLAEDLDDEGALIVRLESGAATTVSSGEVQLSFSR